MSAVPERYIDFHAHLFPDDFFDAIRAFFRREYGLEVAHRDNPDDARARLVRMASEHDLVVTGASDYHGAGKDNRLGERTSSLETWNAIRSLVAVPGVIAAGSGRQCGEVVAGEVA